MPAVLKNYQENRNNGTNQDEPKNPFPSDELENITNWQEFDKAFDLEEDHKRGYPEKFKGPNGQEVGRYWFIVKHKQSGSRIEGFSQEPDVEVFPDKDKRYNYFIKYTECGLIKAWMEEKDLNYLGRIEHEDRALYEKEIAELKVANPEHPAILQLAVEEQERFSADKLISSSLSFPMLSKPPGLEAALEGNIHATNTKPDLSADKLISSSLSFPILSKPPGLETALEGNIHTTNTKPDPSADKLISSSSYMLFKPPGLETALEGNIHTINTKPDPSADKLISSPSSSMLFKPSVPPYDDADNKVAAETIEFLNFSVKD